MRRRGATNINPHEGTPAAAWQKLLLREARLTPAPRSAGNASKVSRQQAFIQRTAEGHFYIRNIGARKAPS